MNVQKTVWGCAGLLPPDQPGRTWPVLLLELGHQLADPLAGAVGLLPLLCQSKLLISGSQLSFPDMERLD